MNVNAREIACRSASSAEAFALELERNAGRAARSLRAGQVEFALDVLERDADRVQKFLTFLSVAVVLLRDAQHPLSESLAGYEQRLLAVLDRVSAALDRLDFAGLTLALEHGMAVVLRRYHPYAPRVRDALRPRLAA